MTTVAVILEAFTASRNAASTRQQYGLVLAPLIAFLGPDRPLEGVTGDQISSYLERLKTEPNRYGRRRKASTVRNHVQIIKAALNWAAENGAISAAPVDRLKAPQVMNDSASSKAMTDAELLKILEYWRYNPRNYALVLFLADTGCRIGGAADLQISRLDLVRREALITEKGGVEARVLFGPLAATALAAWLETRPAAAHDYVWLSQRGDAMTPAGLAAVIRTAAQRTGSVHTNPHALRHRVGIGLARSGKDPDVIRAKLNHSDVLTTLRFYCRADAEHLQQVSDEFVMQPAPAPAVESKIIRVDDFRRSG